jgi:hypothetical protein
MMVNLVSLLIYRMNPSIYLYSSNPQCCRALVSVEAKNESSIPLFRLHRNAQDCHHTVGDDSTFVRLRSSQLAIDNVNGNGGTS